MYDLLNFKSISPFFNVCTVWLYTLSKSIFEKTGSERTSYYIDGPMHSVFPENSNLTQVKGSDTQIHTINYYIEEIYPILIHWWGVYAILILCWGIRCLIILLSYTQHYYTQLRYTLLQYIAGLYPILTYCWGKVQSYYIAE